MKLFSQIFPVIMVVMILFSCQSPKQNNQPKNVILLISDGTGLSQISSAYYNKKGEPNYSRFENIGLINTSSSRQDVTDSAAGATAFSCGMKTYNGAIGVDNDSISIPTIVELIQDKKIKTGVISTSSITHATPASFYAHQVSRSMYEEIAMNLSNSDIDFFAGGGKKFFARRNDGVNLISKMENNGFEIDTFSLEGIKDLKSNQKVGYLLADDGMPKIVEGRGDFLPKATDLGINFLNNERGFFLMIEGAQIDWGGHANDADYTITELLDFDLALGKSLDFAEKDGNTLIVVVSDHETGGFTLSSRTIELENGMKISDYSNISPTFSTGGHSASLIPVFAYGPGAEEFRGVYQNNEIFHKIMKVTQWVSEKNKK